jgi:hypothetical protein
MNYDSGNRIELTGGMLYGDVTALGFWELVKLLSFKEIRKLVGH